MSSKITFLINNIALPFEAPFEEALTIAKRRFKEAGIIVSLSDLFIYRRSIDARKRDDIKFVYSVGYIPDVPLNCADRAINRGISISTYSDPSPEFGECKQDAPFLVVGSGPAGMFSALLLSEAGFKVILIERGSNVKERTKIHENFVATRILDENTNIQFGAGGAGTFSDGKLVTRINDSLSAYVLNRLVEFGAPSEILTQAKPHIGTDILSVVVDNILCRIESLGGQVLYNTRFIDFKEINGRVTSIRTDKGEIECSALILATGHSARDTYIKLISRQLDIEAKDFSVGLRIEHKRSMIDRGLYGEMAGHPLLPSGEYNLSCNTKQRGVYTFCMCPGGEVVPATSELGGVVVNGMSRHARNGENSNSAVCCSIFRSDFGATPIGAIEMQRAIEMKAFTAGGSDYSAPYITVGDFLSDKCTKNYSEITPSYMGGSVRLIHPSEYLPEYVVSGIKNALLNFDKKIPGFASPLGVLTGPETRTSAPLRIIRDSETKLANRYSNLYPCGEGAGYAGGITSAAIDGIKCALALTKNFKP